MPATDVTFGISRVQGALIESNEETAKIEKKELKGSTGNTARVKAYDPKTSFSVKGHGTLPAVSPGFGASGLSDLAGGLTLIEEVKTSEKNDDFNAWEYSGINYPSAQQV
ncbi:MAG TPA: hypothetical protein VGM54_09955 [Chthoniobacter sp.]|jgi:hypothetical protein